MNNQLPPPQDDPELAAIATQLKETASYAINPTFKEKLRLKLLVLFKEQPMETDKRDAGNDDYDESQDQKRDIEEEWEEEQSDE